MITVGSLFSGIGGIELGLEQAGGFRTEWFVEKDEYAQAVLNKHWPGVPVYTDITEVQWEKVPEVDVLTGGFPCQDISHAGAGAGIKEGTRSGLWFEYVRVIRALRPKIVFVENVSALLGRGLDIVLGDLAALGYDAEWDCVPASAVGAPHRRDRIFIIAYSNILERGLLRRGKFNAVRSGKDVADTHEVGCDNRIDHREERHLQSSQKRETEKNKSEGNRRQLGIGKNRDVSNSDSSRRQIQITGQQSAKQQLRGFSQKIGGRQWSVEPDVGRVAHGVSFRVDRIKCLGNAVVPQVAEFWAERIKEIFHERRQKGEVAESEE